MQSCRILCQQVSITLCLRKTDVVSTHTTLSCCWCCCLQSCFSKTTICAGCTAQIWRSQAKLANIFCSSMQILMENENVVRDVSEVLVGFNIEFLTAPKSNEWCFDLFKEGRGMLLTLNLFSARQKTKAVIRGRVSHLFSLRETMHWT